MMDELINAVLGIIGNLPHLLHPGSHLVVMALGCGEGAKEGIHALELILDVLHISMDALNQPTFLGEKATQFAQETSHRTLS
jgi:hypothetical protein